MTDMQLVDCLKEYGIYTVGNQKAVLTMCRSIRESEAEDRVKYCALAKEKYYVDIERMGMSKRYVNALHRADIYDAKSLFKLSYKELKNIRGIGTSGAIRIIDYMKKFIGDGDYVPIGAEEYVRDRNKLKKEGKL